MKHIAWFTLLLVGCATAEQTPPKLNGEQVISSLMEISDRVLSKEPLCDMISVASPNNPYTLKDHLSVVLSSSYESNNITTIKTNCDASKQDLPNGQILDIWDCKLTINESSVTGEFISASTIAFGLDKNNLKYVPLSLRCF